MHKILDSLRPASTSPIPLGSSERGGPAAEVPGRPKPGRAEAVVEQTAPKKTLAHLLGLFSTDAPPPTDEGVERILEEERMRK
jgi:hypothetical protein